MPSEEADSEIDDSARRRDDTMSDGDRSRLESRLESAGEPFARATIVRREPPVSANVGDKALITADGELHGWIGGVACAQSVVTDAGLESIADRQPRLLGLAPDPDTVDRPGLLAEPMRCHSEGTLEVYVEPVVPQTQVVLVGDSPITRSLRRLARELPVSVAVVDPDGGVGDDNDGPAIIQTTDPQAIADAVGTPALFVVASMGAFDAHGVAAGILADAAYIGFVASDKRAATTIKGAAQLLEVDPETVESAVTNPAGVDVAAYRPAEIAVSILAELVDVNATAGAHSEIEKVAEESAAPRDDADEGSELKGEVGETAAAEPDESASCCGGEADEADGESETDSEPDQAIDPVCEMVVDTTDPGATVSHDGETYYFCCPGCANSFEIEPSAYLPSGSESKSESEPESEEAT